MVTVCEKIFLFLSGENSVSLRIHNGVYESCSDGLNFAVLQ